jgi:hypothetical protein
VTSCLQALGHVRNQLDAPIHACAKPRIPVHLPHGPQLELVDPPPALDRLISGI